MQKQSFFNLLGQNGGRMIKVYSCICTASLIPLTSVRQSHLCRLSPNVHPETGFCSTDEKKEKDSSAK